MEFERKLKVSEQIKKIREFGILFHSKEHKKKENQIKNRKKGKLKEEHRFGLRTKRSEAK